MYRKMLNKVPEVTFYFWVIKIMCTTVGESAADYLNVNLGFGLTNTTYVAAGLLVVLLAIQFGLRRYVPGVYWSVVVVVSVFGTLITDNLTDAKNVALTTTTPIFAAALAAEKADLGYGVSILVFGSAIAVVAALHYGAKVNAVLTFWLAYILTRPLGASMGDFLSQNSRKYGGLGLGTTKTSYVLLACILVLVTYLGITKRDQTPVEVAA